MKKVQILLSTYNGEKYLKDQLDSILKQDYDNITLLVRDDGSSDKTVSILKEYAKEYKQITYYQGENIGVINSFFDLIRHTDMLADYYSFSDQDDVWKYNKITRAVSILNLMEQEKPLLYCGTTTLVDKDLEPIISNIKQHNISPDFGNALVENICTGCTSVMNKKLFQLIAEHIPNFTVMHDWWFYLTASCFGKVYYDHESFILYRQHDKNVIGTRASYWDEFKMRLRNYRKNRGQIRKQVAEFNRLYKTNQSNQQLIKYIIEARKNLWYRLKILLSNKIHRQRKTDNMIFKILFLTGKV